MNVDAGSHRAEWRHGHERIRDLQRARVEEVQIGFGKAIAQNHHIEAGGRRSAVDEGVYAFDEAARRYGGNHPLPPKPPVLRRNVRQRQKLRRDRCGNRQRRRNRQRRNVRLQRIQSHRALRKRPPGGSGNSFRLRTMEKQVLSFGPDGHAQDAQCCSRIHRSAFYVSTFVMVARAIEKCSRSLRPREDIEHGDSGAENTQDNLGGVRPRRIRVFLCQYRGAQPRTRHARDGLQPHDPDKVSFEVRLDIETAFPFGRRQLWRHRDPYATSGPGWRVAPVSSSELSTNIASFCIRLGIFAWPIRMSRTSG